MMMSAPTALPPSTASGVEPTGRSSAVAVTSDLTPVLRRRLEDLSDTEAVELITLVNATVRREFIGFLILSLLMIVFVRARHETVLFVSALAGLILAKVAERARLKHALRDTFQLDDENLQALHNVGNDERGDTVIDRAIRRRDRRLEQ